jgi:hypothetical protein
MSGLPGRSGGHNRLSVEEQLRKGTYRADRHGPVPAADPVVPPSKADRRLALAGLPPGARAVVSRVLSVYGNWSQPDLLLLRQYGLSCDRLEALQAAGGPKLHAELRVNLSLSKRLCL